MPKPAFQIDELSAQERLDLLEALWDSLQDDDVPVTDAQREELDSRLDAMDADGDKDIPWDRVKREMSESPE